MSNLQIITELCGICQDLARIVSEQQSALAQHDALFMEAEIAKAKARYTALIGHDEWPETENNQKEEHTHDRG